MDKEGVDPDRVKNELSARDVIPEDWAVTFRLSMLCRVWASGPHLSVAELLELKAHFDGPGQGVVVDRVWIKVAGPVYACSFRTA